MSNDFTASKAERTIARGMATQILEQIKTLPQSVRIEFVAFLLHFEVFGLAGKDDEKVMDSLLPFIIERVDFINEELSEYVLSKAPTEGSKQ